MIREAARRDPTTATGPAVGEERTVRRTTPVMRAVNCGDRRHLSGRKADCSWVDSLSARTSRSISSSTLLVLGRAPLGQLVGRSTLVRLSYGSRAASGPAWRLPARPARSLVPAPWRLPGRGQPA